MRKPTRFYSNKQEKSVAKAVDGKQTLNSGATPFQKGDIQTKSFLIECKTKTELSKSMTIQKEWITKNKEEAFAMRKPYSALVFNFGPDSENYYIIDQKLFNLLQNYLEEDTQ